MIRAERKRAMYERLNATANPLGMTVEEDAATGLPKIMFMGAVEYGPAVPDFITVWLEGYVARAEEDLG